MPGTLVLVLVLGATFLAFNVFRKWVSQLALRPESVQGPAAPNLILGHTMLFDSPVGMGKHLLWNSQFGPTYCLRGPFLVSVVPVKRMRLIVATDSTSGPRRPKGSQSCLD